MHYCHYRLGAQVAKANNFFFFGLSIFSYNFICIRMNKTRAFSLQHNWETGITFPAGMWVVLTRLSHRLSWSLAGLVWYFPSTSHPFNSRPLSTPREENASVPQRTIHSTAQIGWMQKLMCGETETQVSHLRSGHRLQERNEIYVLWILTVKVISFSRQLGFLKQLLTFTEFR